MAHYEPRFKPSVAKDLRGIPTVDVRRILYTVTDSEVLVEIVKIGHRGDVYRET